MTKINQKSKQISPLRIQADSPVEMTNWGDKHSLSPLSSRP